MLKDYMFTDSYTGEVFLVETDTMARAFYRVVEDYACGDEDYVIKYVECNCVLSVEEGEALGYDTY